MVKVRGLSDTLRLLLVLMTAVLAVSCASSSPEGSARIASAATVEQQNDAATLMEIRTEQEPAPRIVIRMSAKPVYTSYSPQPDVFVVDLPRSSKGSALTIPADLPAPVASISADEVVELGNAMTRVTVRFSKPWTPEATALAESIVILMPSSEVLATAAIDPGIFTETIVAVPASQLADTSVNAAVGMVSSESRPATRLEEISPRGEGENLEVALAANGSEIAYSAFRLTKPDRLVVDLKGIRNFVRRKKLHLPSSEVMSVRVSQFQDAPAVTRVVFDLAHAVEYKVIEENGGLRVAFGPGSAQAVAQNAPPMAVAKTASTEMTWPDVPQQVAAVVEPAMGGSESRMATQVINSASAQTAPSAPRLVPTTAPAPPPRTEDVFVEDTPRNIPLGSLVTPGQSRTLSPGERNYVGEPIDLTLKEVDIKDVLRTFAQITGLNIAIDPGVTGTVTVEFTQVPWDQALELILKQNGLTYELQGSVMRIGTLARLAAEQATTRKLEEDQSLNVPLQTVIKHLSYAKGNDVQSLLKEMASPRGKIIVDARTNQLVITEVPRFLQTMLNLIETVDIPTPQVMIEARIVETTKNFLQQYGVNWGFRGSLDPALGTGTGLIFPNRVGIVGGPFTFGPGNPLISLTLSNVLGTFDLDVALNAAESEGVARIVSAPKVTTQDNQAAEIQSGIQIPIQTRVNFTTTIQYIDATLRLSVTPQVTAQDTVIMDIQVQKVEPLLGLAVLGGTNSPLSTRRAQTRLMVRDGGTTVIGGIYQATDNDSQTRVPFLHQIPILGYLFKDHNINSRHDELLIFITPRIIRNT